ncbi:MAG: sulfatase/phosphatase domain-containing protein, partial [Flavobacteriaceae bacterium]
NIDDNLGRLFDTLDKLKIADNTLVIFMTDNGPQQVRYVAGMRGRKGSVYRGGIRVPFYLRYPKIAKKGADIEVMAAHIDVLPTLAEVCGLQVPQDRKIDGQSMFPFITDTSKSEEDRPFFSYWTRRYPEKYQNISLQKGNYTLVGNGNYNDTLEAFELFDLKKDPYELNNVVLEHKNIAEALMSELNAQYTELISSENITDSPRIHVGTEHENPVTLNRNDAGGERGIWDQEEVYGKWAVKLEAGTYNIKFKFVKPLEEKGNMVVETGAIIHQFENDRTGSDMLEMKNVVLPAMTCDVIPFYTSKTKRIFPFFMEMERIVN